MNHTKFLDRAYLEALSSPGVGGRKNNFRIGSLLVLKKRVVSSGYNSKKSDPKLLRKGYAYPFAHAESSCLFKYGLQGSKGGILYVVRIKKDRSRGLARPCEFCYNLCSIAKIKRIVYSISNHEYGIMEVV